MLPYDLDPKRTFQIDAVFDTNAVRGLGRLPTDEWHEFRENIRDDGARLAWIPWVITEATASNLIRRDLTDDGLAEVVLAARRYDTLCQGVILPSPDHLMWHAIHRFADVPVPPYPRVDVTRQHRMWLDRFFCAARADQVKVEGHAGSERTVVIQLHDKDRSTMGSPIPVGFVDAAARGVGFLAEMKVESPGATRATLSWQYFRHWLPHTVKRMGVSEEVVRLIDERFDPDELANSPFMGGLVESWFIAERVSGNASKPTENDARDIAISSYLSIAAFLVTNDRRFTNMVKALLRDTRRIVTFEAFLKGELLLEDSVAGA